MKLKILFFGATADAAGERAVTIEVPDECDASAAFRSIVERFPVLSRRKLLFSVNQEYANGSEKLSDGDELAVFTAVSGG
jgi:molybdopterin converting factor small subunit